MRENATMPDLDAALRLARQHVTRASRLVDEQAERVARMNPAGDDFVAANDLLQTMQATLAEFVADLARLEAKAL